MFYLYCHREIIHSLLFSRIIPFHEGSVLALYIRASSFFFSLCSINNSTAFLEDFIILFHGTQSYMVLEIVLLALLVTKFSTVCHYSFLANTLFKSAPLFLNDKLSLTLCSSFQQHTDRWSFSLHIYVIWLLLSNVLLLTHGEWSAT